MSPSVGGTIEVNGNAPSSLPATYTAAINASVAVEAVPASGYDFANWSGDLSGSDNPSSLQLDCNKGITAHFSSQTNGGSRASVGGFVWDDRDRDGILDTGERGMNNVPVNLFDSDDNLIASTTASGGFYSFDNVAPGQYYLFFDAPSPYLFSAKDQGQSDEMDSDANANGRTDVSTLTGGDDLVLDAGVFWYNSNHIDITPQQAKDMIDTNPDMIIVDVREEDEFCDEEGHIPRARNYPWNSGVLAETYDELSLTGDILVICRSGHRSTHASEFLDYQGFTSIYHMVGGMNAWEWETEGCGGGSGGGGGCFVVTVQAESACLVFSHCSSAVRLQP